MSDLSPTTWDAYVGQPTAKARLRVLLDAALLAHRPLDHLLLTAPGTGLGALARIIVDESGDTLRVVPRPFDAEVIASMLTERGVFVFEALETAPAALQAKLATLLEQGYFPGPHGPVVPGWATIIATSDDPRRIHPGLFGRFVVPTWEPYSAADLDTMVHDMVARADVELPEDIVAGMVAAASTPHQARRLVLTAVDVGLSPAAELTLDAILGQAGVYPDGLTEEHLHLLTTLDLLDGHAAVAKLSQALGRPEGVVLELDQVLRARHLVQLGRAGREITPQGIARAREFRHLSEDRCRCGLPEGRCAVIAA